MDDIVQPEAVNEIPIQVLTFSSSVRPAHPCCRTLHRPEFLPSLQACVYPLPRAVPIGRAGQVIIEYGLVLFSLTCSKFTKSIE
ncbi:MAG TPA: hypothetical protein DIW81_25735 [Planctomycetaceae bacterium]|nr:hypothetical protein [Rubinisphaera sp.]HCS54947.1 hypothetical protein [Planctomycetaceae bacterium]